MSDKFILILFWGNIIREDNTSIDTDLDVPSVFVCGLPTSTVRVSFAISIMVAQPSEPQLSPGLSGAHHLIRLDRGTSESRLNSARTPRRVGARRMLVTAAMSSSLNLDEEVRLYSTNAEREKYGLLATLFGIIVALEYLERAYVRDSVTAAE